MKWSENIGEVIFQNKEIGEAYYGEKLFWVIQKNEFWGKFTDKSTEEDWWYRTERNNQISIAHLVNPETKEFNLTLSASINNLDFLFYNNRSIEKFSILNTTNKITSISNMFYYCTNLTDVDLKGLNTSNITDMSYMFCSADKIEHIDFNNFETPKLVNIYAMFYGTSNLEKDGNLNLSSFETSNIEDYSMCFDLTRFRELTFTTLDFSKIKTGSAAYFNFGQNSTNLEVINGNIIFPDDTINSKSINFCTSSPLNNATATKVIKSLKKTNVEGRFICFSEYTYNNLSPEQIKVGTDKGWTITYK